MTGQPGEGAVLFAQMSAGLGLNQLAADPAGYAAIENCISMMSEKTRNAGGRVIKRIHYKLMSAFPDADAAADAAIEMQSAVFELPPVCGTRLSLAIGFNHGPLVERDNDVFGDAVNVAARFADVATQAQIITGTETVLRLPPMLKSSARPLTTVYLKGKAEPIQVYELIWQESAEMTALASHKSVFVSKDRTLRLVTSGAEVVLSAAKPSVSMGRDAAADLVIKERTASRAHGKIERRLDKFILTDHSANGTYLTIEGLNEIVLRREEYTLRGHGWIAFGQPRATAADVVEFFAD